MKHRISGGALVFKNGKILMVRHLKEGEYDFWVAPGGGVNPAEDAAAAAVREAWEEAGMEVRALKLAVVEELGNPEERGCKLWFHCELLDGVPSVEAPEAVREYIIDAQFLSLDELQDKIVFPPLIADAEFWKAAEAGFPETVYLGLRKMAFY